MDQILQRLQALEQRVEELENWKAQKTEQQISFPVDDASRITMGVGYFGETTDTTPGGAIIVNTNNGPVKLLRV